MFNEACIIEPIRDGQVIYDTFMLHAMSAYIRDGLDLGRPVIIPVINQPALEIGKFQNVRSEINLPLVEEKGIQVLRRRAGGGTIYYDQGCLALWFKAPNEGKERDYFDLATQPVVEALHQMGATQVVKTGRNDLVIDQKKISGTAIYTKPNYIGGGVSLLLDVDYDLIDELLTPNVKKMQSKGIRSTRSRVTSIRPYLAKSYQDLSIEDFKKVLLSKLFKVDSYADIPKYQLTEADFKQIEKAYLPAYLDWDWNYGFSPRFEYNRDQHFKGGTVEFSLQIDQGKISRCKIYGDFFSKKDPDEIEQALIGCRLNRKSLEATLSNFNLSDYFGSVTLDELVTLILS